jgi:hypothetical protein
VGTIFDRKKDEMTDGWSQRHGVVVRNVAHPFIHSAMALQPFIGFWPFLQLCNLFYTDGRTPWTSDQPVARPLPKHRTIQTE